MRRTLDRIRIALGAEGVKVNPHGEEGYTETPHFRPQGYCGKSLRPRQLTGLAAARRAEISVHLAKKRSFISSQNHSAGGGYRRFIRKGRLYGAVPILSCRRVWPAEHGLPEASFTSHLWILGHLACVQMCTASSIIPGLAKALPPL